MADDIHFLVFKDNLSPRTFRVSLGWISRLGLVFSIILSVTFLASGLAIRNYYLAKTANPIKVQDLEREIGELKNANKSLETKLAAPPQQSAQQAAQPPAQTAGSIEAPPQGVSTLFKSATQLPADSVPIQMVQTTATWKNKTLNVHFNIQYTKGDGGNQQGHILILARGPNTLLAYPEGVMNNSNETSLFNPDAGEYFSVSRFRETTAEFGPVDKPSMITEVNAILFDLKGNILQFARIKP